MQTSCRMDCGLPGPAADSAAHNIAFTLRALRALAGRKGVPADHGDHGPAGTPSGFVNAGTLCASGPICEEIVLVSLPR